MATSEAVTEVTREHSFFSMLSTQLWKIEKHPFSKIGERLREQSTHQLSYDPTRVFRPEESEVNPHRKDTEFLEFERQQFENEIEVHNQLLKKDIQKKHNSRLAKASEQDPSRSKPFNPFNFDRGRCMRCDRCQQFHGNFSLDLQQYVDVFECMECRCPMNSHPVIVSDQNFSKLLYGYLLNRDLKESHLNTTTFVAAFALPKAESTQHTHNKRLLQLLNEGGYSVLSSIFLQEWQFRHKLTEQRLFDRLDRCIDKYSFDQYFNFFQAMSRLPLDPLSLDFRQEAESIKVKIRLYTNLRQQQQKSYPGLNESFTVYCVLLRGGEHSNPFHFRKLIRSIQQKLHPYLLLYSSNNLYAACVDTQLFFQNYLQVNYQTVLLPNSNTGEMRTAADKLRDVLDYNNFVVVEEDFEQVKRTKLESAFQFNRNSFMLNYLLGQQVVSEVVPQFVMKVVARIGPPHLNNPCRNLDNIIRVREPMQNEQLQKQLCPEMLCAQRCALVMRPALVKSGMDELILNYFRLNDFTLISRVFVKLDEDQTEFFALLENIREEERKEYLEMMGSGLLEVILVSKRAAIIEVPLFVMQANLINQGARYGLRQNSVRLIKESPSLTVTINGKTYKEQVALGYRNALLLNNISQVFNGVRTLFDLQNIILGERQEQPPIVVDSATGQLIRQQQSQPASHERIGPRIVNAILEELNCDTFNYWMYTSTSEALTEQIISQFMPECQLFEWVCVLVKPGFVHLARLIRSHLELLKYKVIAAKTVLLSKSLASNLVNSLLVLRLDNEMRQSLSSKYCNEKVEVLCLAKPGGRREMLSYLTGFTLSQPTLTINVNEPLDDSKLKQLLVPIWTAQPLVLQIISPVLYSLEDAIRNLTVLNPQEQFTVLNFLCGSMLGVTVDSIPLQTNIGQLSYYLQENEENAKLQSWYYATISQKHPHLVPLLFQYRKYGQMVFCLQSHNGQEFIQHVLDGYLKQNLNPDQRKKRHSLVLYLWAKRLAQLVSGLSETRSEILGFGEIVHIGNIYRGAVTDEHFASNELKRMNKLIGHPALAPHKDIIKTLKRLQTLRAFLDRNKKDNKRLLPVLREESLRVIKTSQLTKLHMLDEFQLIDPNHELSDPLNMSVLGLYNIRPDLLPKYSLFSSVYVDLLKYSSLSKDYGKPLTELLELFVALTERTAHTDFQMIGVEIYLKLAEMYVSDEKWTLPHLLQGLPTLGTKLGKLNEAPETNIEGKKRKFIEKKQYFTNMEPQNQPSRLADPTEDKFLVNVYADKKPLPKGALFDPADPQHNRWANETRMVNLIRQVDSQKEPRRGVNVEYEKKISENEELVKAQVNKQVQKYVQYNEEQFLYETGLERHVWYRRVKGEQKKEQQQSRIPSQPKPKPVLEKALDKQVQMFLSFKQKQGQGGQQQK